MADRLSQLNAMALAAGMSYGKFMALHPDGVPIAEDEQVNAKEDGNTSRCQWCNKPLPVYTSMGNKARSDRKFCSPSCRVSYGYYRRKEGATDE